MLESPEVKSGGLLSSPMSYFQRDPGRGKRNTPIKAQAPSGACRSENDLRLRYSRDHGGETGNISTQIPPVGRLAFVWTRSGQSIVAVRIIHEAY